MENYHGAEDGGGARHEHTQDMQWRMQSSISLVQQTSHTSACLSAVRLKSVSQ